MNAFLIKFAAEAIKKHPMLNATWQRETIITHKSIDIGLAVAQPDDLIRPVVRDGGRRAFLRLIESNYLPLPGLIKMWHFETIFEKRTSHFCSFLAQRRRDAEKTTRSLFALARKRPLCVSARCLFFVRNKNGVNICDDVSLFLSAYLTPLRVQSIHSFSE